MSKTLIGNFKGPKGDRGDAGDTGIRGSRWNSGIAITGTSNAATVFGNSGIEDALKNDMYLNTETGNTYRCTVGGTADTAKWVYAGNIKGKQGDKGEKGDPGQEGGGSIATKEDAGSVKPADGLTVEEDGTLKVNIDGTTLTMDQVNNVIKLADTLKDAINGAFPAANVANNQITTVEGFALDARQANPNIDGSLAKQISDLNGSLKVIDCGIACFSRSDSMVDIGTRIKASITFNKIFVSAPVIVVSWRESSADKYCDYVYVDAADLNEKGFNAITTTRRDDTLKYSWWFNWIAIGQ